MDLPKWINYFVLQKLYEGSDERLCSDRSTVTQLMCKVPTNLAEKFWDTHSNLAVWSRLDSASCQSWYSVSRREPTRLKPKKLWSVFLSEGGADESESIQEILQVPNNVVWWQKQNKPKKQKQKTKRKTKDTHIKPFLECWPFCNSL